jgi:fatty-acyl-CoA synthase
MARTIGTKRSFPAVVFVDQLRRNAIGKVLKNKLRETYGDVLLA